MTTKRTWLDGRWISDLPLIHCRTCGVEVPRPVMGGPRQYCDAHRPADARAVANWFQANKTRVREYQRARDGQRLGRPVRPLQTSVCVDCHKVFTHYVDSPRCSACRPQAERAAAWRARFEATLPRICPECRRSFSPQLIGGSPQVFCSRKCRDRNHERTRAKRVRPTKGKLT